MSSTNMPASTRPRYYGLKHRTPIPLQDVHGWLLWVLNHPYHQRVRLTCIGTRRISTVFLGLDHDSQGDPILFETMIFDVKSDGFLSYQTRCSTHRQALDMHKKAIEYAKS